MHELRLEPRRVPDWPKLAWVANFREGGDVIVVLHGPMVEVSSEWIVEAVWAGYFAAGDFDQTDLVFGSGIRLREEKVVFVSAGSVFDRLWHVRHEGRWFVSNTLPGLLAVTGLELRDDYLHYSRDIRTITKGLEKRVRSLPTSGPDVTNVYFHNLVFDGETLREEPKPDTAPHFDSFERYHDYLVETAKSLGDNLADTAREHRVVPLTTISSGYDSCVAATISRHAGCRRTVTIKESTSLWRGSDSGEPVARALGMECTEYPRTAKEYPLEVAIWAAEGRPGIMNWTLFDYPEPLCLLFTGCHGEKLWDRVNRDHPDPFVRRDPSSLGFCEYRLLRGVFQCPLPFWGVRHSQELHAITATDAMKPWYTMRDHDKPIARRIVEEAGVPRRAFGLLNKNTSLEKRFPWPRSRAARQGFQEYLKRQDCFAPPDWLAQLTQLAAQAEILVYRNVIARSGIRRPPLPWDRMTARFLLFQWANHEMKQQYLEGLRAVRTEAVESEEAAAAGVDRS